MAEELIGFRNDLLKLRKYLVKKGKARYQGNIIANKTTEANEIFNKCSNILSVIISKKGNVKPEVIGAVNDLYDEIQSIYGQLKQLLTYPESEDSSSSSYSDTEENPNMDFDLKTACNLIPVMDGNEGTTKQLIDAVEMYAEMLKTTEHSLLIKFVLKSRLSENAKLRMSQNYTTANDLITDLRKTLLTKKSFTALQSRLQTITQGWRTIDQYGTEIEKLFSDLTISQADGNTASYDIIKPLNEKMAIKRFSDGLRDTRLSTIIAARNYDSLKDAIQAAKDEESSSVAAATAGVMHFSRRGQGNVHYNKFSPQASNHYHRQANSLPTRGQMNNNRGRSNYYQNNFRGRSSFSATNRGRGSFSRRSLNGSRVFHRATHSRGHHPMFCAQQTDQVTNPESTLSNTEPNQFFRSQT